MKKFLLLMSVFAIGFCSSAQTQYNTVVIKNNGEKITIKDVKEIYWEEVINNNEEEHEFVDLGLPSGTLWATCNVGASSPEEYGDYFAWGETEPQADNRYSWASYKWSNGGTEDYPNLTKYCQQSKYGYNGFTDTLTELESADDAATVNWGADWQMPSLAQIDELINSSNTTTTWTTVNGVYGRKITSKKSGYTDKYIFLPAAGCRGRGSLYSAGEEGNYWSRSLITSNPDGAYLLAFYSSYVTYGGSNREGGFSVRPVRVARNEGEHEFVDLGLPSGTLWATCNVGASSPEEYGDYYAWGETEPQADNAYSWASYKWSNGGTSSYPNLTKYCQQSQYGCNGFTDTLTELEASDDAASVNWGSDWQMPSETQQAELRNNCYWELVTSYNGKSVKGYIVYKAKSDSDKGKYKNSGSSTTTSDSYSMSDAHIFLPAAGGRGNGSLVLAGSYGYFWSRSLHTSDSHYAYSLGFSSNAVGRGDSGRYCGFSVRPVLVK